ncbi:hypothetical protein SUNI508_01797 [Seiridium unicorne]|uniref:C2H2-type domain-containing protein n=1 Tax=Seiridium unicorne TaxID=138068 RepID=A0ABR2UP14_9PEZI
MSNRAYRVAHATQVAGPPDPDEPSWDNDLGNYDPTEMEHYDLDLINDSPGQGFGQPMEGDFFQDAIHSVTYPDHYGSGAYLNSFEDNYTSQFGETSMTDMDQSSFTGTDLVPEGSQFPASEQPVEAQHEDDTLRVAQEKRFDELPMISAKRLKPGRNGLYRCDRLKKGTDKKCKAEHKSGRDLVRHLRTHDMPVLCPVADPRTGPCQVRTAEQRDMKRHVCVSHPGWADDHQKEYGLNCGPYVCEKCKDEFTRDDNLTRHVKGGCKK